MVKRGNGCIIYGVQLGLWFCQYQEHRIHGQKRGGGNTVPASDTLLIVEWLVAFSFFAYLLNSFDRSSGPSVLGWSMVKFITLKQMNLCILNLSSSQCLFSLWLSRLAPFCRTCSSFWHTMVGLYGKSRHRSTKSPQQGANVLFCSGFYLAVWNNQSGHCSWGVVVSAWVSGTHLSMY